MDHAATQASQGRSIATAAGVDDRVIRADRALANMIDRLRKIDAVFSHAVGRCAELRARILGDREPSSIEQGRERGMNDAKTPPPTCEVDEIRRAILELEQTADALHRQLEGLERL